MPESKKSHISVYLLSGILILTTVWFFFYLRNTDRKYSQILLSETEHFQDIQKLSTNSYRAFLYANKIIGAHTKAERDSLIVDRMKISHSNDSLLVEMIGSFDTSYTENKPLDSLIMAREAYKVIFKNFLTKTEVNRDSALDYLDDYVEPAFSGFQNKVTWYISQHKENLKTYQRSITADLNTKSFYFLLLGISPLIVFIMYLITIGALLIYLKKNLKSFE